MIYLLLLIGILLNAGAQLLIKGGMSHIGMFSFSVVNIVPIGWKVLTNLYIIGGLACYVVSVILWMLVLSRVQVSFAYPMLSIGYIVNALVAYYWFGEDLSLTRIAGILIIMLGVVLIART